MALSDIGSYFANPDTMGGSVKSGLGKVGDFMKSDSMEKLTPFLPAFQDFGTTRFGKTLAGIAQNMASAKANARVQTDAGGMPGVTPQVPQPQPNQRLSERTVTTKESYVDTNGDGIGDTPANQAQPQAPKLGGNNPLFYNPEVQGAPQMMQLGGSLGGGTATPRFSANPALGRELSFTKGGGDQTVGTPAPVSLPTPETVLPAANNPQTYVQNLNKAPMGDLMTIAGNFGYPASEKALSERLNRDIAQGELGTKDLTARASYLKAVTDNALLPYEIGAKSAQAAHYEAQVKEIDNKIQASLPSAIEQAERAKTIGIEAAKLEVAQRIVSSEAGKQPLQPELGFPKGMTVGSLYALFGAQAPEVLRTAMSNAATIRAAEIGGDARIAAAKVADTNMRIYLDALNNGIKNDQTRLKEMNDTLYDPAGTSPTDQLLMANKGKKPMTPQQLNDYRVLNELVKAKSNAYAEAARALAPAGTAPSSPEAYNPNAPAPPITSITVNGQKITGRMQADGTFLGDNGKPYKPKK